MKKVSVIVPVYNVEKYLRKCLDSLVNQTLSDIEIIVVNDGSPDNSQVIIDEYVKKYPDKVISIIKENGGQGSARNIGLEKATGEYIGYVDSDDYVELNMYEELYNKAKEDDSDIVICGNNIVSEDYQVISKENVDKKILLSKMAVWNKLFKRSFLVDNKIVFRSKVWYEDLGFTMKVYFSSKKISYVDKYLYNYLLREGSTMNNNNSLKNLDMITVLDDLKEYAINNNVYNKNLFSYLIFDHVLITTINRVAVQTSKDKQMVLNTFVKYCHDNISDYKEMDFYKDVKRNRKIIAWLNYHKLYNLSKFILKVKPLLKRGK